MAINPGAHPHLFDAAAKLHGAREDLEAAAANCSADTSDELELLELEVTDLGWRTQDLAMRVERRENPNGPWVPATDFPSYDPAALLEAAALLLDEAEDVELRASSLPAAPNKPDKVRRALVRAKAAAAAVLRRVKGLGYG